MENISDTSSNREDRIRQDRAARQVLHDAGVMFESSWRTPDGTLIVESASDVATRLANMGILQQAHIVQLKQAGFEV